MNRTSRAHQILKDSLKNANNPLCSCRKKKPIYYNMYVL